MNDIQIYNHWVNQNLVTYCRCYNNPEIMKFSIGELHIILLNSNEFHEHTVRKSHTLLKALIYLVLIISIFLDSVTWHMILKVYPYCCSEVSCLETSTLSHTLLKSLKEFLPVISTFLLQSMLRISDSQPGIHTPPGVRTRTFRGMQKKLNNGGKRHICQQCKTRYYQKLWN